MGKRKSYSEKMISAYQNHPGKYTYDARQFNYDNETKTFSAIEGKVWDLNYPYAFPSGRSQFCIFNPATKNFRRFRLQTEDISSYKFASEDDEFFCVVEKTTPLIDVVEKILKESETFSSVRI